MGTDYSGLKIRCPSSFCRTTEWDETTEEFDPNASPHGGMVRRQEKWRKMGVPRNFNHLAKHYQICCGRCGASLITRDKKFVLAEPLPVEPNPNWQADPEGPKEIPDETIREMRDSLESEPKAEVPDLLAAYQEFKEANPNATWRQAYEAVPNECRDHLEFASVVRQMIKEAE